MTVYLVHQPRIASDGTIPDFQLAAKFGNIVTLLTNGERPGLNPGYCSQRLALTLANFKYDQDYILWVGGDPLALMLVSVELARLKVPQFTWLRYSKKIDPTTGEKTADPEYKPTIVILAPPLMPSR